MKKRIPKILHATAIWSPLNFYSIYLYLSILNFAIHEMRGTGEVGLWKSFEWWGTMRHHEVPHGTIGHLNISKHLQSLNLSELIENCPSTCLIANSSISCMFIVIQQMIFFKVVWYILRILEAIRLTILVLSIHPLLIHLIHWWSICSIKDPFNPAMIHSIHRWSIRSINDPFDPSTIHQMIHWMIHQSIEWSINPLNNRSIHQMIHPSINPSIPWYPI